MFDPGLNISCNHLPCADLVRVPIISMKDIKHYLKPFQGDGRGGISDFISYDGDGVNLLSTWYGDQKYVHKTTLGFGEGPVERDFRDLDDLFNWVLW